MRIFLAAAVIAFLPAFLAGPICAQEEHIPQYREPEKEKSMQQKEADKAAERAYQRSLGNVPDKAPVDPWGTARSLNEPKAEPKSAKATKAATKAAAKPAPVKPTNGDTD
jgi:hypothetical protein